MRTEMNWSVSFTLLCALAAVTAVPNVDAAPIRPDILKLMEETKLKDMSQASLKQVHDAFRRQFAGSLAGNPQADEAVERMMERLDPILEKKLSWEVLQEEFAKLYEQAFTPEEVKGLLDFYHTPAGQAFLKKMPLLSQKVAEASAQRVQEILPEVQRVAAEVGAELQKKAPPVSAAK